MSFDEQAGDATDMWLAMMEAGDVDGSDEVTREERESLDGVSSKDMEVGGASPHE